MHRVASSAVVVALALFLVAPIPSGAQVPPPRFATLEAAVAAGVVDPELPAAVAAGGVDAMVELLRAPAVAAAEAAEDRGEAEAAQIEEYGDALDPAREEVAEAVEVRVELPTLSVMAVRVASADELLALANQVDVTGVDLDRPVTLSTAESLPIIRQPEVVSDGITGAGVAVAVLDSGVEYLNPAFGTCALGPGSPGCRVLVSEEVAPNDGQRDSPTNNTEFHGTRVAAIVAATAPAASLLVYDVFNGNSASSSALASAVQRVILRKVGGVDIRALNGSFSGGACAGSTDFGLADALAAGILPVIASGNNSATSGLPWPSCNPAAVAVGATADASFSGSCGAVAVDQVMCYSNSGPQLDVLAPGSIISAAGLGGVHGTSFAAPFVSGAVALLAHSRPTASPDQIRDAIVNTGPSVTDPRNGVVRRRLDVAAARTRLTGAPAGSWGTLGGAVVGDPDAAAWGGRRVDVFVRGTDDQLWHQWWDGTRWAAWEPLGGRLTSAPTVVAWGPNRLDVFARGTDGAMYQLAYDGTRWSSWIPHGGQLQGAPDVASWAPGRLDVFVRGTDNGLYQRFWNGTSWSGWVALGGSLAGSPGAVSWSAGRLDVFARATDGQLWHRFHDGSWFAWEPLFGAVAGDVDAASFAPGRLDVFAQAGDQRTWQRTYDGQWRPWSLVDEALVGSGPGSADRGRALLDVFVRGTDGALWYRSSADGTTW